MKLINYILLLVVVIVQSNVLCFSDVTYKVNNINNDTILYNTIEIKTMKYCDCDDPVLCLSIARSTKIQPTSSYALKYMLKQSKIEVFAFVLNCTEDVWSKFDWSKLTTIALAGFDDSRLTCYAHSQGVKVVKLGNIPKNELSDPIARTKWVKLQLSDVILKFLDGINIDFEDEIADKSEEQRGLTLLVKETTEVFHETLPGSQVSVDVAWSATGVDNRFYDYSALAKLSDILFVMSYDEQSQMWTDPCIARPNSGIYKTAAGLQSYLDLGIPATKLVLGVPWYGYKYPCVLLDQKEVCYLEKVPFRGCNCSDAAGKEYPFSDLVKNRQLTHAIYRWDKLSLTPHYSYKDVTTGQQYQVRYDDARSLPYKYMHAQFKGLRGIGMWTANFLDYSDTEEAKQQRQLMWSLLP